MTFSRSHVGMIGIISLFTGMIAPLFGTGDQAYPLPLTSLQILSYCILFLLAFNFYLISVGKVRVNRLISGSILSIFIYISFLYISNGVFANTSGKLLDEIHWGIYFIVIGILCIIYSFMSKKNDTKSEFTLLSDTIIGVVGAFTLIGLSALIIAASIGNKPQTYKDSRLEKLYLTGGVQYISGIVMSGPHTKINSLVFDRKNDTLSYISLSQSGGVLYPEGIFYTGTNLSSRYIGEKKIITSDTGIWIDNEYIPQNNIETKEGVLKIKDNQKIRYITKNQDISYTGSYEDIGDFSTSEEAKTIAWSELTQSGYVLKKDGTTISQPYKKIESITLSKTGKDILALGFTNNNEIHVLKNGTPIETLRATYIPGSWKSNGIHSIYTTHTDAGVGIIYDGVSIGKDFIEVRDIFLEKNGNSYSFFARNIGENTYCFTTRFKGSLCGLEGYMNPGFGADGGTIIYAGLKDGTWSLYRNTSTVIQDTGYTRRDISGDYVFYDTTNPRQYLFIEKLGDKKYQLRKNGEIIPGSWNDVGLEVWFGYDENIIMTTEDSEGWRIIEL